MGSILPLGAISSQPAPGSIIVTIFLQTWGLTHGVDCILTPGVLSPPPSLTRVHDSSSLCSAGGSSSMPSIAGAALFLLQHAGCGPGQGFCNRSETSWSYAKSTLSLCLPVFSGSFIPSWKLLNNLLTLTSPKKRTMKTPASELLPLSPSPLFFPLPTRTRRNRVCTSFLRSWLLF